MVPVDPPPVLRSIDFVHITVTVCLFLLNFLVSCAIGRQRLIARANYLGPEMVYLAAAIVASHIFTMPDGRKLVSLVAIFPYLVGWAVTLLLTKRVIEVGREYLHPLTVVNLLCGGLAVYMSMTGVVEAMFLESAK